MLRHNQKIPIRRVKSHILHILARSIQQNPQSRLSGRITCTTNKMQPMNPVDFLIEIKRVPAQLIGDIVQFVLFAVLAIDEGRMVCAFRDGLVVGM